MRASIKSVKCQEGNNKKIIVDKNGNEIECKGVFIPDTLAKKNKDFFKNKEKLKDLKVIKLNKKINTMAKIIEENKIEIISEEINKVNDLRFIWSYFERQQRMFPDLDPQDISRLIYLATYCGYNTNKLQHSSKKNIKQSELMGLMGLTKPTYYRWIQKMQINGYIIFNKDDTVSINTNAFSYGTLTQENNAIRIFIDFVRDIYKGLKPNDHIKMGYALQLIPFINPYFNCLCTNPYEMDRKKIKSLRIGKFLDILGISRNQSRKIANQLLGIKIGKEEESLIALIALNSLKVEEMFIVFNAKLFFGGNAEQFKTINSLFLENKDI